MALVLPVQVRNCRLAGLVDLMQRRDSVRSKITAYMNRLIDVGVAGFRIDASKHMWPEDINAILAKVNNLNTQWFSKGSRPFVYQEVNVLYNVNLLAIGLDRNHEATFPRSLSPIHWFASGPFLFSAELCTYLL